MQLTKHVRHARLVKLVRRTYQEENQGARLFPNPSGVAWQGNAVNGVDEVILKHPRPIKFGIPEPGKLGTDEDGSGGADLLGVTIIPDGDPVELTLYPIFTAIECKTGKSKLKKNQARFRDWVLSINGIHYTARECPECWERWEPFYQDGKIIYWLPEKNCPVCGGRGYIYD